MPKKIVFTVVGLRVDGLGIRTDLDYQQPQTAGKLLNPNEKGMSDIDVLTGLCGTIKNLVPMAAYIKPVRPNPQRGGMSPASTTVVLDETNPNDNAPQMQDAWHQLLPHLRRMRSVYVWDNGIRGLSIVGHVHDTRVIARTVLRIGRTLHNPYVILDGNPDGRREQPFNKTQ